MFIPGISINIDKISNPKLTTERIISVVFVNIPLPAFSRLFEKDIIDDNKENTLKNDVPLPAFFRSPEFSAFLIIPLNPFSKPSYKIIGISNIIF